MIKVGLIPILATVPTAWHWGYRLLGLFPLSFERQSVVVVLIGKDVVEGGG